MTFHRSRRFLIASVLIVLLFSALACALPFGAIAEDKSSEPAETGVDADAQAQQTVQADATATLLQPTATATAVPRVLPAPLYFLSGGGPWSEGQLWRIEMNGGSAHPVIGHPIDPVFDVNPVDGRLVFVYNNDLIIAQPDGSGEQIVVDGPDLSNGDSQGGMQIISEPLWSLDGRQIAYNMNGVHLLNVETREDRVLITDQRENMKSFRALMPSFWSPDGQYLGVRIQLYEGAAVGILPLNGGEMIRPDLWMCCDVASDPQSGSFYLASDWLAYGEPGFWKIDWASGAVTRLSPEPNWNGSPDLFTAPYVHADGRLLYFAGPMGSTSLISSTPSDFNNRQIVKFIGFQPLNSLWAKDGSLVVITGKELDDPMQVVYLDGRTFTLPVPGARLRWGVATSADEALALTPAPTLTPTATLPALPASAQVINTQNLGALTQLAHLAPKTDNHSIAISPDNRMIAIGLEHTIEVWDMQTMTMLAELGPYENIITGLSFSPDGRSLAAGSWDTSVDIWTVDGWTRRELAGHTGFVQTVEFSPDGTKLASAGDDNTMIVWDAASGAETRRVTLESWGVDVAWAPDGSHLAAAVWDGPVHIWSSDGSEVDMLSFGYEAWAEVISFSPDSKRLAIGTMDHRVKIYDLVGRSFVEMSSMHTDVVRGLAFSPDGTMLVSTDQSGEVFFWNPNTGQQLHRLTGQTALAYSNDGRYVAASGEQIQGVKIWYIP